LRGSVAALRASELAARPLGSNPIVMVGGSNWGSSESGGPLILESLPIMVPVDGLLSLRASELATAPLGSNRL